MRDSVKGATIICGGIVAVVDKVFYAYKEREGWDIEFIDTNGNYRHWKQWDDLGVIRMPKRGKRLINSQGTDCTDLFRKYGYNV